MKSLFTISVFCLFFSINNLSATVYTTVTAGDYNDSSIWEKKVAPPRTLLDGDEIIINHAVNLTQNLGILGKMTINVGGSLIGTENIKVGKDGYTGELINHGVISANEVDVKGINSSGSTLIPIITNNGTITANLMDVGNNNGFGKLRNSAFGTITVAGELHVDNILSNAGVITVNGMLKNHGGTITGGGTMTNCNIELSDNGGRVAALFNQDICCDYNGDPVVEPTFSIGPNTYNSLAAVETGEGLSSSEHIIDMVDYYSCGINAEGGALPVELIEFSVRENKDHYAVVSWSTASELDNDNFTVERSLDGRNFVALGVVTGAGTTEVTQTYSFVDRSPASFAYYRLKQVDFDGRYEYSDAVTLKLESNNDRIMDAYPTIADQEITIRFTSANSPTSLLQIVDSFGRLIFEEEINSSDDETIKTLDLARYNSGVYHIVLFDGELYRTNQFVVARK